MSGQIETMLEEMGERLPTPPEAVGAYVPVVRFGNLVVTSGQLPFVGKEITFTGKVGSDLQPLDGYNAARICAINALAQIKSLIGDLDLVKRIVRVEGYVQSAPGFRGQPQVLNGASELFVELFGDRGKHTRIAVPVSDMPLNAAVQLSVWVEINQ